jgi:hypothetical protein
MNRIEELNKDGELTERTGDRLELDGNCYATRSEGIVRLYSNNDAEIFSIDANTVPFDKKILGAVVQVYLLGLTRGASTEKTKLKEKLGSIIKLAFE